MTASVGSLAHFAGILGALAWARYQSQFRPPPRSAWKLGVAAAGLSAAGDVLLFVTGFATGLTVAAFALGFILGLALLMVSLLQGWPSPPLLVVGFLAAAGPFLARL